MPAGVLSQSLLLGGAQRWGYIDEVEAAAEAGEPWKVLANGLGELAFARADLDDVAASGFEAGGFDP